MIHGFSEFYLVRKKNIIKSWKILLFITVEILLNIGIEILFRLLTKTFKDLTRSLYFPHRDPNHGWYLVLSCKDPKTLVPEKFQVGSWSKLGRIYSFRILRNLAVFWLGSFSDIHMTLDKMICIRIHNRSWLKLDL